ncbi:hypothetical protein D9611_008281 [Ephemerocybe angulata]|uniref:CENP-C homolog n=1 Tax=Ephemerocybe angulata TaxID=980116 RepID=A0A8H5BIV1_9AGAR|nr:hypothetical protein D9611_008281 [Tulosesus angulatus]
MPSSARKSSLGTSRRALQKAHIPYRGDNPEVGKKTGIAVQHVQRMSDGFEPFEEVLQQADGRTPPRPRGRKKSSVVRYDDDEDDDDDEEQYDDDEYGEMSMQLDSPVQQNLASMRAPTTPTTNGRPSSRPVARSSNVDFDKIPSPRPRNAANAGPGPSRLSRSYVAREPSSSPQDNDNDNDDTMQLDGGFDDDFGPQEGGESSPRRTNFSQMDHDDDDDDENEPFQDDFPPEDDDRRSETPKQKQSQNKGSKNKDKGKSRAREEDVSEDEQMQMEDDIARGLDDISNGQQSDQDVEEDVQEEPEPTPEPTPRPKKVKIVEQEKPRSKTTQTRTHSNKENREYREGVRRSAREHYAPLEYWRGEKVVYGRDRLVPSITEIIRIPKEPPAPLGKRRRGRSRSKSRAPSSKTGGGAGGGAGAGVGAGPANLEEGWDDDTPSNAKVLDYRTGQEVERRIAWTARMVNPQPVANNSWSFDKIFGDADFIAAGQLVIPPKSRKPSKATKDNTYIFYVVEGAVNLKVHETSMVLSTGGMFMVPRGNTYFIENISQRDARLFFTQARKTMNDEDERMIALANRPKKLRRSSSAGAMRPGTGTGGRSSVPPNPNSDGTPLASRAASTRA